MIFHRNVEKSKESFNEIPTRKIGKIFYLAILEALTIRSVSRVNSLKIRIAVRFKAED